MSRLKRLFGALFFIVGVIGTPALFADDKDNGQGDSTKQDVTEMYRDAQRKKNMDAVYGDTESEPRREERLKAEDQKAVRDFYAEILLSPHPPAYGFGTFLQPLFTLPDMTRAVPKAGYPRRLEQHDVELGTDGMILRDDPRFAALVEEGKNAMSLFIDEAVARDAARFSGYDQIRNEIAGLEAKFSFPRADAEGAKRTQARGQLTATQKAQIKSSALSQFVLEARENYNPSNAAHVAHLNTIEALLTHRAELEGGSTKPAQFKARSVKEMAAGADPSLNMLENRLAAEGIRELAAHGSAKVTVEFRVAGKNTLVQKADQESLRTLECDPKDGTLSIEIKGERRPIVLDDGPGNVRYSLSDAYYETGKRENPYLRKPSVANADALVASVSKLNLARDIAYLRFQLGRAENPGVFKYHLDNFCAYEMGKKGRSGTTLIAMRNLESGTSGGGVRYEDRQLERRSGNERAYLRWAGFAREDGNYWLNREAEAQASSAHRSVWDIVAGKPRSVAVQEYFDRNQGAVNRSIWRNDLRDAVNGFKYHAALTLAGIHLALSGVTTDANRPFVENLQHPIDNVGAAYSRVFNAPAKPQPVVEKAQARPQPGAVGGESGGAPNNGPDSPSIVLFKIDGVNPTSGEELYYTLGRSEAARDPVWHGPARDDAKTDLNVSLEPQVFLPVQDRYTAVPAREGQRLLGLSVSTLANNIEVPLKPDVDYEVHTSPETGLAGIVFKKDFASVAVHPVLKVAPNELPPVSNDMAADFYSLDRDRLIELAANMQDIGMTEIAHDIADRLAKYETMNILDLQRIVSADSVYTHDRQRDLSVLEKWKGKITSNPLYEFLAFAKSGRACGTCDLGGALWTRTLQLILPDYYEVESVSAIASSDHDIDNSRRHRSVRITDKRTKQYVYLDATPHSHWGTLGEAMLEKVFAKIQANEAPDARLRKVVRPASMVDTERTELNPADRPRRSRLNAEDRAHISTMSDGDPPFEFPPIDGGLKQHPTDSANKSAKVPEPSNDPTIRLQRSMKGFESALLASFNQDNRSQGERARTTLSSLDFADLGESLKVLYKVAAQTANSNDGASQALGAEAVTRVTQLLNELPPILEKMGRAQSRARNAQQYQRQAAELLGISYNELSLKKINRNLKLFENPDFIVALSNLRADLIARRPEFNVPAPRKLSCAKRLH